MKLTKQEYYDLLFCSALDGTFPSVDQERRRCLYRGPNNVMCAFGILIPDEKYGTYLEEKTLDDPRLYDLAFELTPEGMTRTQLVRVQALHDEQAYDNKSVNFAKSFLESLNNLDCFKDVNKLSGNHEFSLKWRRTYVSEVL